MPPGGNEEVVVREGENILERRRALDLGTTTDRGAGDVGSWLHWLTPLYSVAATFVGLLDWLQLL